MAAPITDPRDYDKLKIGCASDKLRAKKYVLETTYGVKLQTPEMVLDLQDHVGKFINLCRVVDGKIESSKSADNSDSVQQFSRLESFTRASKLKAAGCALQFAGFKGVTDKRKISLDYEGLLEYFQECEKELNVLFCKKPRDWTGLETKNREILDEKKRIEREVEKGAKKYQRLEGKRYTTELEK